MKKLITLLIIGTLLALFAGSAFAQAVQVQPQLWQPQPYETQIQQNFGGAYPNDPLPLNPLNINPNQENPFVENERIRQYRSRPQDEEREEAPLYFEQEVRDDPYYFGYAPDR